MPLHPGFSATYASDWQQHTQHSQQSQQASQQQQQPQQAMSVGPQQQQQQFLLQQQQQLALHHQQQQQQAANGSHMHGLTNAETQQRLLEMQLKRQQIGVADGLVPQINQVRLFFFC